MGISDLSERTECHTESLYRFMRALCSIGIFKETEPGVFCNTHLSECLKEGRLKAASLLFHSDWHDQMWNNLSYSIKTGKSAFENEFGEKVFEWFKTHQNEGKIFHAANSYKAAFTHRAVLDVYDFKMNKRITDIGGGFGGLMFEILEVYKDLYGVIADLPDVIHNLQPIIAKKDFKDRIMTEECNFFDEISSGSDIYLLSNILHDWNDQECITILKNCRNATGSEGKILIIESIVPEDNTFSISKLLDLEVLLMGGGKERTENEYRLLLEKSGFGISNIISTQENISVIEGIPVSIQ